jgi:hypothetical protein
MSKLFAVVQCGSLVIGSIARVANDLMVTPLELTTLSFVISAVVAYVLWLDKPFNVERPMIIEYSSLQFASSSGNSSRSKPEDMLTLLQLARQASDSEIDKQSDDDKSSTQRINDVVFPDEMRYDSYLLYAMGALTAAIQLAAWNSGFSNAIVRIVWRTFAVGCMAGVAIPFIGQLATYIPHHWEQSLSIWFGAPVIFITVVYVVSRIALFILSFYCLSSLPVSAYDSVDWTKYIPHFS